MKLRAVNLSAKAAGRVAALLSPAGARAQLLILTYHRVLEQPDPLLPGDADVATFRMQLRVLREGWTVLPLAEAAQRLSDGSLPARAAAITFDDGYASNAQLGVPLLREEGLPATFFVATGFLDGGRMFNDTVIEIVRRLPERPDLDAFGLGAPVLDTAAARLRLIAQILNEIRFYPPPARDDWIERFATLSDSPLPDNLMMTRDEVAGLVTAGMEVGAHTVHHPILTSVAEERARAEIRESIDELERITGTRIESFAYPNGRPERDYAAEHVRIVAECGIRQAVSTAWGAARRGSDRWQLPRVGSWDKRPVKFAGRLLRAYVADDARRA